MKLAFHQWAGIVVQQKWLGDWSGALVGVSRGLSICGNRMDSSGGLGAASAEGKIQES